MSYFLHDRSAALMHDEAWKYKCMNSLFVNSLAALMSSSKQTVDAGWWTPRTPRCTINLWLASQPALCFDVWVLFCEPNCNYQPSDCPWVSQMLSFPLILMSCILLKSLKKVPEVEGTDKYCWVSLMFYMESCNGWIKNSLLIIVTYKAPFYRKTSIL